jgi:hypothetical protein
MGSVALPWVSGGNLRLHVKNGWRGQSRRSAAEGPRTVT